MNIVNENDKKENNLVKALKSKNNIKKNLYLYYL